MQLKNQLNIFTIDSKSSKQLSYFLEIKDYVGACHNDLKKNTSIYVNSLNNSLF